jgi:hypothetical protein
MSSPTAVLVLLTRCTPVNRAVSISHYRYAAGALALAYTFPAVMVNFASNSTGENICKGISEPLLCISPCKSMCSQMTLLPGVVIVTERVDGVAHRDWRANIDARAKPEFLHEVTEETLTARYHGRPCASGLQQDSRHTVVAHIRKHCAPRSGEQGQPIRLLLPAGKES